ncbi:MAG: hypothetical protein KAT04_02935 [Methylococcales bacterium]|nr:hypothetical protein [Methylococcales bacterium]
MPIKTIVVLLVSLFISSTLTACSDDKPQKTTKKEQIYFDHSHGSEVSNLKKHTFEHKFAKQCVEREVRNSVNKENDRKRFTKPCLCIATRIMRNLTAVEAEKFLVEKKSTQSLKMSFDEAAYFCLQNKKTPKAKKIFGR